VTQWCMYYLLSHGIEWWENLLRLLALISLFSFSFFLGPIG
jgi:hypothetical protein